MRGTAGLREARRAALLLVSLVCLIAPSAAAWNPHGHMLIALVAFDALPEPQRAALISLLEAHPRFREDLARSVPAELRDSSERARWLFAHAATWPDLVRGQAAFDRGTWHYVNLPLALGEHGLASCQSARRELPASVRRLTALDAERRARGEPGIPTGDSILAALPDNLRTLGDRAAPRRARALALSWVLHLVADAHQPLHGVALFTRERFVTGDRGGNDIQVGDRGSLHRVWDGLLGEGTSLAELQTAAGPLAARVRAVRAAGGAARDLRVDTWINESCELARRAVYVKPVLDAVRRFERAQRGAAASREPSGADVGKPSVSLGEGYQRRASERARERAALASARLAALLGALPP